MICLCSRNFIVPFEMVDDTLERTICFCSALLQQIGVQCLTEEMIVKSCPEMPFLISVIVPPPYILQTSLLAYRITCHGLLKSHFTSFRWYGGCYR